MLIVAKWKKWSRSNHYTKLSNCTRGAIQDSSYNPDRSAKHIGWKERNYHPTLQKRFSSRATRKKWLLGEANIKTNLKFASWHLTNPAIFCSLMALTLVWKWSTIFSAKQTAHETPFWTNQHHGQQPERCVQDQIILQQHNDLKQSKNDGLASKHILELNHCLPTVTS